MSSIQDSLDQLLQVITNGNDNERIECHYLVEHNSVDSLANDRGELILHVAAERDMVIISYGDKSEINIREGTSKSIIELRDKTYEFLHKISALVTASDRCTKEVDVLHLFLEIIHRECGNDNQKTAEKLISLQYPLWEAVVLENAGVIEHMIIHGCPVDDYHPISKCTALNKAVQCMNLEIIRVLIKYGADVDVTDNYEKLPIAYRNSWCTIEEQSEIMKILLNNSKLLRSLPQESFLQQFIGVLQYDAKEIIEIVIEYRHDIFHARDDQGMTILHYLAENFRPDIFELLRGRNIDVNVSSTMGYTPLFMAARSSVSHINTFKFLLENGANVNVKTPMGEILLFELCDRAICSSIKKKCLKIIKLVLQYDLDIQVIGPNQKTVFDTIIIFKLFYIAKPLLAHLAVLEDQGTLITEHIRNKINSNRRLKNYFELCKSEITNIKSNSIDQGLTLYKILVTQEEKLFNTIKSHVNSLSKLETLKKQCCSGHAYYGTIRKRICSIAKRIELYRKAVSVVCKLIKLCIDMNHLVTAKIMGYLNNQDFYNLINVDKECLTTNFNYCD